VAAVANCGPYDWGACWDQLPTVTRGAFRKYSHSTSEEEAREKAHTLSLEGVAEQIEIPLMVIFGKQDPLIPWQQGQRVVDEAKGEAIFLSVDHGGHSVNDFPYLVRPQANDWLAGHLGGRIS
jgi:2,6-dihydroxypseudooxynicotine hydrolase